MALTVPDFGPGTTGTSCTVTVQCVDLPVSVIIPLTPTQVEALTDASLQAAIDTLVAALTALVPAPMTVTGSAQWQIYGAAPAVA